MFQVVSSDLINAIGLSKAEIDEQWLAEFGRQTALIGVKDMFKNSNHFSICKIDDAVKATGRMLPRRIREVLSPLHCVHWNAMDREILEKTLALCAFVLQPQDD